MSDFSDFFGGAGDWFSNLFGGSSDTTTAPTSDFGAPAAPANSGSNVDPVGTQGAALPSGDSGSSAPASSFFSLPNVSPAASTASALGFGSAGGSTSVPGVTQPPLATLASLSNGAQVTPGGTSAASATGGQGYGGSSPIPTSPDQQIQPPVNNSPSTMQAILQALGITNKDGGVDASTGSILKGLVGAGGLAYNAFKGSGDNSAEKAVKSMAQNADTQGTQLESYLANGTLPPGAQQYVNQQTAAQKASILSKYAQNGMTGSTAEAQELAQVDVNAQSQMFQIASALYQNGVSQTGASSQLYKTLMDAQNQDNTAIGNAISNFVASLSGGSGSGTPKGTITFGN